jgi:hypothetical protein
MSERIICWPPAGATRARESRSSSGWFMGSGSQACCARFGLPPRARFGISLVSRFNPRRGDRVSADHRVGTVASMLAFVRAAQSRGSPQRLAIAGSVIRHPRRRVTGSYGRIT